MKGTNRRARCVFAASLLCGLVGGASGQEEAAPQSIFSEVLDVRVVNVEIVVTDRDGIRVSGLEAEDFELLVDREPTTIDYFSEIRGGRVTQIAEDAGEVELPGSLEPGQEVSQEQPLDVGDLPVRRSHALDRVERDPAAQSRQRRRKPLALAEAPGRPQLVPPP